MDLDVPARLAWSSRATTSPSPPFAPVPHQTRSAARRGSGGGRPRRRPHLRAPSGRGSGPGTRPRQPASPPPCTAARSRLTPRLPGVEDRADRRGQVLRVRHRQVDRAGADPLGVGLRRPDRLTSGFGRPAISISRQVKLHAAAERLADRLLAGEPGRVVLGRVRPRVAVLALGLGEARAPESRDRSSARATRAISIRSTPILTSRGILPDSAVRYSTVTVFARFRGWSTFRPRRRAIR